MTILVEKAVLPPGTLDVAKNKPKALQRCFDRIEKALEQSSERAFKAQGPGWAPLKTPRAGGPILDKTGKLKASITKRNAPGAHRKRDKNSIERGTDIFYAKFHQKGTRKMPARPFMNIDREGQKAIALAVKNYTRELLTGKVHGS